jgi:hypothetical protein
MVRTFGGCDVRGAAQSICISRLVRWGKRNRAFRCKLGYRQDVGGCVEIAQAVSANETTVACEGNVTFEDTRAHTSASILRLDRLFWELECTSAAVSDNEAVDGDGLVFAGLELGLKWSLGHVVEDVVWAWTEGDEVLG